ncbi:ribosome silencing factor [Zeimonas arvi]|uniref:Ribosomal silencing factor RsfS n=1 Tax=Zeimonas arvi TaxID=2498847 RepID=A0A5C8P569_9BURK|nr:ribosome silencing factor [Zeimonas arvi]TXL68559.1 ribosome silencing factor [Zeimonas arvi]
MDIKKLQRVIVDALEDVKAQDIKVFDTTGQTQLFDRVIVASGTSNRQTRALASNVRDKVKEAGGHVISVEGEETGEWVLVDLGDAVVHVMQPSIRDYYRLEEIWGEKPVPARPAPARKPVADKATAEKPAAKKPAAKKPAAKKPAAKRPATKTAATKTAATNKPAAKKAAAPKAAASKPAAKKPAARKPGAG